MHNKSVQQQPSVKFIFGMTAHRQATEWMIRDDYRVKFGFVHAVQNCNSDQFYLIDLTTAGFWIECASPGFSRVGQSGGSHPSPASHSAIPGVAYPIVAIKTIWRR